MVMHLGEAQNNSFFIKFNFVLVYITKGLFGTAYAGFSFIYFAQIEAL